MADTTTAEPSAPLHMEPPEPADQHEVENLPDKPNGDILKENTDVEGVLNGILHKGKGRESDSAGQKSYADVVVRRDEKVSVDEEVDFTHYAASGDSTEGEQKVSDHIGQGAGGVNSTMGEPPAEQAEDRPESEHDMEEIPDEHSTTNGVTSHRAPEHNEGSSASYAAVAAEHIPAGGPSVDMRNGVVDEDEGIQVEEDNDEENEEPALITEAEQGNGVVGEEPADNEGSNEDGNLVHEKLQVDGTEQLTSFKRSDDEEKDEKRKAKRDERSTLVSGRQAGAGWRRSSVRFAPLNVPLQRRLQTGMVLFHTLSIALFLTLFWFLCAIPLTWPLLVPYLIYLLLSTASTSGTLSHRSDRLRRSKIWSLFASYFPARLHRSEVLPPTRKYVFGYHPHGIISHGAFAAFSTEALGFSQLFPGITNTLLTLDSNFRIPIYRDYILAMGLASVSRVSCENILSKGGPNGEGMGRAITIVVGGAAESLDAQPGTLRLVLKKRKGFVKLAIRTGADLVPVLAFGENELYEQLIPEQHTWIHKFQMGAKKVLGFTIPLFHARGVFNYDVGIMPYRRPLNVVVGRPIKVMQYKNPEPTYVDEVHAQYVKELERLWFEWRGVFAKGSGAELEILE